MVSRRGWLCALVATACCFSAPPAALADAGDLDPTFGGGTGKSVVDLGAREQVEAMVLEPSGRIAVAGTRLSGTAIDMFVARFRGPTGTLDTSFALGNGYSVADFGSTEVGNALALQPDGRLIAAGVQFGSGKSSFAVTRVRSIEGTFDPSFSEDGRWTGGVGAAAENEVHGIALEPDGKILLAGSSQGIADPDLSVARLDSQGVPDPNFGYLGFGQQDFGGSDFATAMVRQPDGKLVIAGFTDEDGDNDFLVARFNNPLAGGDFSFNLGAGALPIGFGGSDRADAVALQPDGNIVVVGRSLEGNDQDFALARVTRDGGLDSSFSNDGVHEIDFGTASAHAKAVLIQPDGKILVAGEVGGDVAVLRLHPSGLPDQSFGNGGTAIVDWDADDQVRDLALQVDGKIVVAGFTSPDGVLQDVALARLQADPLPPGGGPGPPQPDPEAVRRCGGRRATIIGTPRRDVLHGTRRADVIAVGQGADRVRAGRGNDVVCGGRGKDVLRGGPGRDRLLGGSGRDHLLGGPGRDRLLGGPGRDRQRP